MGKFKVIYQNKESQEVEADGFYQKDNHFEFYKDSAVGEKRILSLHGTDISHVQNLDEIANSVALSKHTLTYHSGHQEEIQADGYRENGEWFDFYRDSAVGEKIMQSVNKQVIRHVERTDS